MTGGGLCLPQLGPHVTVDVVAEFARRAEALGYSGLWVQDHFMYPLAPTRGYGGKDVLPPAQYKSVWAPTEMLAFVAGITSRVVLGMRPRTGSRIPRCTRCSSVVLKKA